MKPWLFVSILAMGLTTAQGNISVTGVPAFAEVKGTIAEERSEGKAKVLNVGGSEVRINPWPVYAPRALKGMNFLGSGFIHPEGPSYRLEFSKPEQKPTLILGVAWPRGREAVVGLSFMTSGQGAALSNSTQTFPLGLNRSVVVRVEGERWCVRLLNLRLPQPDTPGVANEHSEPRFDWMAVRC